MFFIEYITVQLYVLSLSIITAVLFTYIYMARMPVV